MNHIAQGFLTSGIWPNWVGRAESGPQGTFVPTPRMDLNHAALAGVLRSVYSFGRRLRSRITMRSWQDTACQVGSLTSAGRAR